MTCKDCISFAKCLDFECTPYYGLDAACNNVEQLCENFKNKADFVEVVRCKDCEYWNHGYCEGIPFCGDYASCILTEENDFCSYGKRKEDAE